mgnify:CR=1 FL=1
MKEQNDFDLDLIEYKIKERYEKSMSWLKSLRSLLNMGTLTDQQKQWLERCKAELGACLASSIQATENLNDPDDVPRYMYDDSGCCSFTYKGVEFNVQDLRNMRKVNDGRNIELYSDVCIVCCDFKDENGCWIMHVLPDAWLYGSTGDEFEKYCPVHSEFLKAADKYIEKYGQEYLIEAQEADDDE